jgi:hypothetical protein
VFSQNDLSLIEFLKIRGAQIPFLSQSNKPDLPWLAIKQQGCSGIGRHRVVA